jgi:phosphoribosylformylglycinamidine synthase
MNTNWGSSFAHLTLSGKTHQQLKMPLLLQRAFNTIQELILEDNILAGHDIGSGGLITTLLEMCLPITI